MKNLYEIIKDLLKEDPQNRFYSKSGEFLSDAVYSASLELDSDLLNLLLQNERTKKTFFKSIKTNEPTLIFDKVKFGWAINNKEFLGDSYTRFKNKIGLTDLSGELISAKQDVVLSFPYKDCVLVGGQDKEDTKREERFYNELLGKDEIDCLLAPKVFTNAKEITQKGTTPRKFIKSSDNLLIKGNNLIVLSSLLNRYQSSIQAIIIDPPYFFKTNKPSDTFQYNSNFKLSSWLVFMKNRLELAYKLLKPQGVLFCNINEDAVHHLKILTDEIFGAENFVETFIWRNTDNADSLSKKSRASVEYILCYEKNKNNDLQYIGKTAENGDAPLLNKGNNIKKLIFKKGFIHFNIPDQKVNKGKSDRVEILNEFNIVNGVNDCDVELKGEFKWSQKTLDEEITNGTYFLVKTDKFSIRFQRKNASTLAPEKLLDNDYLSKAIGIGTNEDALSHLRKMGLNFSYSKPESLLGFLIKAVTKKNDIVLDFFCGSGSTLSAALKLKRRFIGIEQLDYIESITCSRLIKVIEGEKGGISSSVNWQGGGSFVYLELKKLNQVFIDEINNASSDPQLVDLYYKIARSPFINYRETTSVLDLNGNEFALLPFNEKKKLLIDLLDKNMLYVNYSDREDPTFKVTENEKSFSESFYNPDAEE